MSKLSHGAALASAAALMAISMASTAAPNPAGSSGAAVAAGDKVHCYNVHSCKGNSDCKTAENACKGMNACKGHGFKAMSAADCKAKGGKVAKS